MANSADPDQLASSSLDLHCLQRQCMSGFSRTRGNIYRTDIMQRNTNLQLQPVLLHRNKVLTALLCFRHLSESRFLLGALHKRSKFANFYHDLMQTTCRSYLCTKSSIHWILKNRIFSLFPIVKMSANLAKSVG